MNKAEGESTSSKGGGTPNRFRKRETFLRRKLEKASQAAELETETPPEVSVKDDSVDYDSLNDMQHLGPSSDSTLNLRRRDVNPRLARRRDELVRRLSEKNRPSSAPKERERASSMPKDRISPLAGTPRRVPTATRPRTFRAMKFSSSSTSDDTSSEPEIPNEQIEVPNEQIETVLQPADEAKAATPTRKARLLRVKDFERQGAMSSLLFKRRSSASRRAEDQSSSSDQSVDNDLSKQIVIVSRSPKAKSPKAKKDRSGEDQSSSSDQSVDIESRKHVAKVNRSPKSSKNQSAMYQGSSSDQSAENNISKQVAIVRGSPKTSKNQSPKNQSSLSGQNAGSDHGVIERRSPETDKNQKEVTNESALDFRPVEVDGSHALDPSWDTNKVYFNEYVRETGNDNGINMFDAEDSWVVADATFSVVPSALRVPKEVDEEEKKEKEPTRDDVMRALAVDQIPWPTSTDDSNRELVQVAPDAEEDYCDDANLLARDQSDTVLRDSEFRTSKGDRIKKYEVRLDDDSSKPSRNDDDHSSNFDEDIEIGYISQDSDEELFDLLGSQVEIELFGPGTVPVVGAVGSQEVMAIERKSTKINEGPSPSPAQKEAQAGQSFASFPLPPPPPPPPGTKKKRKKNRNKSGSVPLLAPPPPEKLKKWEEGKNKPSLRTAYPESMFGYHSTLGVKTDAMALNSLSGKALSPVSSSQLFHDSKMAEKVDRAISAAADVYDHQGYHSLPRHSSPCSSDHIVSVRDQWLLETSRRYRVPKGRPSPFEEAVATFPNCLGSILSFLGDPVAVCRVKMLNKVCKHFVEQNEHVLMRDAVRLGGMRMNVRPYFWLWVALEKGYLFSLEKDGNLHLDLTSLNALGREGKWSSIIERDVARAFGNLPPHKTGARLRTDSIVRALATWGRCRMLKRGVRGAGEPPPPSRTNSTDSDDASQTPTDTVSDWGGVTPVGSFGSGPPIDHVVEGKSIQKRDRRSPNHVNEELALTGETLTDAKKVALREKLRFILHVLSAAHQDVGYCQGMDYVVAHTLRILQDTIRWMAVNGNLPEFIDAASEIKSKVAGDKLSLPEIYAEVDKSRVVEETCFHVMNSFFTTYSLRHFYWPELRCLKTCCLVFDKLIKIKLPVLADHFEHHELNVSLFALGWFQTLFLYLPSMPSATVCHMWDIWLVERSFKIFFRVGTAILFLSQPILLNYELEGMMGYLNTFPDATLLSPDILIACALQIKVTNSMLQELEAQVKAEM